MLLKDLLIRQKNNSKVAIKKGNKEINYKQWYKQSKVLEQEMYPFIKSSKNIAIFLPNSIEYAISYFSILFANRIVVPIGVQTMAPELCSTLTYCEIDLIITSSMFLDKLKERLREYSYDITILIIDGTPVIQTGQKHCPVPKSDLIFPKSEDDVAIMLHTSGTTSMPKRVMLSNRNIIKNIESNIQSLELTNNDKTLISIPMYFGYCNTAQFLTQVYLGSSIYIYDGLFMPNVFFKIVQEEKITNFTAVPSILLMILNYRYHDKYDISSLKYIFFGGSSIPKQKLSLIMDKFSTIGFVQTYGQTEASPRITALLPCDAYRKLGSVGKPIKNVNVSIRDDAGNEVAQGQVGEVAVKGPNVMKGYYKREDITEQTIIDGWLYTGDLGFLDNEGYLYLTGRKKNMIISGGINIYPEEIEEILLLHQNVLEVCVLSESHPLLGEVPIAKIVLRDKQYVPDFKKYCEDKLAAYKIPTKFYFVDELEKTYNGKIKRRKDE